MEIMKKIKNVFSAVKSLLLLAGLLYSGYLAYDLSKKIDITDIEAVSTYIMALPPEILIGVVIAALIVMAEVWS
jgi:uncharacterized membrane protein